MEVAVWCYPKTSHNGFPVPEGMLRNYVEMIL